MIPHTFDQLVELGAKAKWEEKIRLHNLGAPDYTLAPWDETVESVKNSMREDARLILMASGIDKYCNKPMSTELSNSCNMHRDCAADEKLAGRKLIHCYDDCCEDCFGQ